MNIPYHPKQFFHWTLIKVQFRDLDPLKHVNNAIYNSYFEEARIDFISRIPSFKSSMDSGNSFILVHIEIDYIKPIFYGGEIQVGTSVEEYGNSSIKGIQAIYDSKDKGLKAVAKATVVWLNIEKNKPVRLPDIPQKEKYLYKPVNHG